MALQTVDAALFLTASLDGFQTCDDVISHIQRFGSRGNALTCTQKVPGSNTWHCTGSSTEHIVNSFKEIFRDPAFLKSNCRDSE